MDFQLNIENNVKRQRFQALLDNGEYAFIDYRFYKGNLAIMHTEVPPSRQGQGIAAALAKAILDYARQEGLKVNVFCFYVGAFLKRHPEYIDLLDMSFKEKKTDE